MIQLNINKAQAKILRDGLASEIDRLWEYPGISRNDFLAMDKCQQKRHELEDILEHIDTVIATQLGNTK